MPSNSLTPLLWFIAIIVMIPFALWMLKRTPLGGGLGSGPVRTVASLAIAPNQRLLTVEVGQGDERRWLVLGVSPGSITALHTMAPQAEAPAMPGAPGAGVNTPFAQLLGKLRHPGKSQ